MEPIEEAAAALYREMAAAGRAADDRVNGLGPPASCRLFRISGSHARKISSNG
jgi:hypothetical protein